MHSRQSDWKKLVRGAIIKYSAAIALKYLIKFEFRPQRKFKMHYILCSISLAPPTVINHKMSEVNY